MTPEERQRAEIVKLQRRAAWFLAGIYVGFISVIILVAQSLRVSLTDALLCVILYCQLWGLSRGR